MNAVAGAASAARAGLVYVTDAVPGIRRVRRGKSFGYLTPRHRPLKSRAAIARIRRLAIPPAYTDVWICTDARGHLQATGRDARGRKQFRYHADWRRVRDDAKFQRMVPFGEALPRLRRTLKRDLALPGLPREKVLAVVVSLLDATRLRVGNVEYARDNDSYGLTTLRNRHVQFVRDGRLVLRFRGKGGTEHEVPVDDRRLARLVRACQQLPGQSLFQYLDDAGNRFPIDSGQVNDYLQTAMGAAFTAKDFRTWGATLHALLRLVRMPLPAEASERTLTACVNEVIRDVAATLRNTPAVCRKSYINPMVFEAWRSGELQAAFANSGKRRRSAERAALAFFRRQAKSNARRR